MDAPPVCDHVKPLCTPAGLQQVSRAAEAILSPAHRPVLGVGAASVPQCLHPACVYPLSRDLYACVHCVHVACRASAGHLASHFSARRHALHLSAEHAALFCAACDDFVHNRFLDSAIELQRSLAATRRRNFTSSLSPLDPPLQPPPPAAPARGKKRRMRTRAAYVPSEKELALVKGAAAVLPGGNGVRPPVGLFNLGNSCYMNSVLQAFLNAPPLRNFFLANEHRPRCARPAKADCFACAMDRLVCDACLAVPDAPVVPFLVPQNVLDIVWRHAEHLASYTQHDAHEFLIAAINLLNSHCRVQQSPKKKAKTESKLLNGPKKDGRKLSPVSPVANLRGGSADLWAVSDLVSARSTSIVQNLFSGTLQSDVVCRVCGSSSPTLEKFYDISLDVDKLVKPASTRRSRAPSPAVDMGKEEGVVAKVGPSVTAGGVQEPEKDAVEATLNSIAELGKRAEEGTQDSSESERTKDLDTANTLQDCLSRFTEPELLGPSSKMHCSTCGTRQEAMKQLSIRTLPPIVCFHFKRFEQSFASIRRNEMVKIDTPIEFPADGLDLSSFQTSEVLRRRDVVKTSSPRSTVETALLKAISAKEGGKASEAEAEKEGGLELRDTEEAIYDLFAIVNHIGKIDSGHYTSMIRKQGSWYRCDDDKVSPMRDVERVIRSEEAYLVFYVQRHPNVQY